MGKKNTRVIKTKNKKSWHSRCVPVSVQGSKYANSEASAKMWPEARQLSIQQWFSGWQGWTMWLNSTKRLILSNGVPLWRRLGEATPPLSFSLTYSLSRTHTHLLDVGSIHPPCRSNEYTQKYIHISNACSRMGTSSGTATGLTHTQGCTLMKRQGNETTAYDKHSCNCFWERVLVAGCHRLVVCSVCGWRPEKHWSLLDSLWYHFITSNGPGLALERRQVVKLCFCLTGKLSAHSTCSKKGQCIGLQIHLIKWKLFNGNVLSD